MLITLEQLKTSLEATLKEVDKKASQEDLELCEQKLEDCENDLTSHINDKSNPHSVNLSQLGVSATPTELDYMKGVTSEVQTQFNDLNTAVNKNKNNISSANIAINTNKDNITTLTTNLNNEVTRAKGVEAVLEEDAQTADALIHKLSDPLVSSNYATILDNGDDALIRNMVINGKTTQKEGVEVEVENDLLGLGENFSHQYAYEKTIEKVNGGGTLEVSCGKVDAAYGLSMSFYYDDYQVGNSIELMNNSTQTVYLPPSSGINKIKIDNTYSTPVPWGVQNLKVIDINNRFITKFEGISIDYPQEMVSSNKLDITICGKNLFNKDNLKDTEGITKTETGFILKDVSNFTIMDVDKVRTMGLKPKTAYRCEFKVKCLEKPDIISSNETRFIKLKDNKNAGNDRNIVSISTDSKNWVVGEIYTSSSVFTTTDDVSNLRLTGYTYWGRKQNETTNRAIGKFEVIDIIITEGGAIVPYEPYKGKTVSYELPIKMNSNIDLKNPNKNGVYYDYIDLDKGKLIQVMDILTADNITVGSKYPSTAWGDGYITNTDVNMNPVQLNYPPASNLFANRYIVSYQYTNTLYFLGVYDRYPTKEAFKQMLIDKGFEALVILETPIEHELPQDLINQLRTMYTYNSTTNIISNLPVKFNYKINLEAWSALSNEEKLETVNNDTEMLIEMISGIIGKDDEPEVDLTEVNGHMANNNIHVTLEDKERWDNAAAGDVTVDNALSDTSINPVQNKVVTEAISSQDAKFISINSQIEDLQERDNLIQQAIDGLVDNNTTYTLECPSMQTDTAVKVNLVPSTGTGTSISLIGSGGTSVYSNSSGSIVVSTDLTSLGITASADELNYVDGVTGNIQTQLDNKASNAHGAHVEFSTADPIMAGIADAGSATTVSRSDHVHPAQVNVAGNAGTATKLASAANINGMSFDGSNNVESFGTLSITSTTITVTGTSLGTGTPAEGWQFITRFTSDYTNTTASIVIGSSTISKTVRYRNSTTLPKNLFKANTIYNFVYTGSYWDVVGIYPQVGCDFASNDFAPVTVQQLNSSNPGVGVGFKQDASNYYGYIGMSELDGKLHRHLSSNKTTYYTVHDTTTIQSGSVQVPLSGSAAPYKGSVNVTFTNTFSSIPNVVLTPVGSTPEDLKGLTVSNISTSGFTINIAKGSNFATTVQWMACGGY